MTTWKGCTVKPNKAEEYLTFEQYACNSLKCTRKELQWFVKDNPTRAIILGQKYAEAYHKAKVNAISDEFKKILEDESDCKGIYLTKGTIRGSEALDAFEIWKNELLKQ